MLKHIKGFKIEDRKSHATIALQVLPIQFSDDEATKRIVVVSKCDVLTTYLSCLDCILIKIDARQLHDFLSSWKSLKFSV